MRRTVRAVLTALAASLLSAAPAVAQWCWAANVPMGQSALRGIRPVCENELSPIRVRLYGNPNFGFRTYAPHAAAGSPTFLVVTYNRYVQRVAVPPSTLIQALGVPGLLGGPVLAVYPGGPSSSVPGPFIPFALPPIWGSVNRLIAVQTVTLERGLLTITDGWEVEIT